MEQAVECWKSGRLMEAERAFRSHLKCFPEDGYAMANLGNVHRDRGCHELAVRSYEAALEQLPGAGWIESNRLMTLQYSPEFSWEELLCVHRKWGDSLDAPPLFAFKNQLDPERKIRVGLVSGDFRWHSVGFFLLGWLQSYSRDQLEITCYSENRSDDALTDVFMSLTDAWVNTAAMDDAEWLRVVRRSRVDILIDLSCHSAYNRMQAMAQRAAPVQVTWLGYPMQTGSKAIDHWLTHRDMIPDRAQCDKLAAERPFTLDGAVHCYQPPVREEQMPVRERRGTGVVFGCFNHRAKITSSVLGCWAKLLHVQPNAKLLLKGKGFNEACERTAILQFFDQQSIDPERIRLMPRSASTLEHLRAYGEMDVALDTFPYNGTTTTMEALWMGKPVVTLKGNTPAGLTGEYLLRQLGMSEWIAADEETYCSIARRCAESVGLQKNAGMMLRQRLRDSSLMDARRFSREMEHGLRLMWQRYCESQG